MTQTTLFDLAPLAPAPAVRPPDAAGQAVLFATPTDTGGVPLRYYYRCRECLSVSSVDGQELAGAICGACGGRLESMGRVSGYTPNSLVKDRQQCVCDGRCTCADGPLCDCHCGGKNHGLRRRGGIDWIWVEAKQCKVPRVTPRRPDLARMMAEEYRQAVRAAEARLEALAGYADLRRGERVPYGQFMAIRAAQEAMDHAAGLKNHRRRIAALAEVAQ